jgi:hypothetical protein
MKGWRRGSSSKKHLLCKHKALISNPSPIKRKKKKEMQKKNWKQPSIMK